MMAAASALLPAFCTGAVDWQLWHGYSHTERTQGLPCRSAKSPQLLHRWQVYPPPSGVPGQGEAIITRRTSRRFISNWQPTTLSGGSAFAQAVPANLASMPMLLGGPAPKESAVGTPITHFNTRVTKLDEAMRPQRPADAADADSTKADDEAWTALTSEQEEELISIMKRDLEYEQRFRQQQQEMEKSLKDRIDSVRPPRRKASDGTITKPSLCHGGNDPKRKTRHFCHATCSGPSVFSSPTKSVLRWSKANAALAPTFLSSVR